jgi:hypothetical protein
VELSAAAPLNRATSVEDVVPGGALVLGLQLPPVAQLALVLPPAQVNVVACADRDWKKVAMPAAAADSAIQRRDFFLDILPSDTPLQNVFRRGRVH